MYGHGAAPPPPSGASVTTQRVLYAAAGILSCGMLSCVPLFRVAFLRSRTIDWAMAWVSIPLVIACVAVTGSLPETDYRTDIAVFTMLLLGAAAAAYYLVVDIRLHYQRRGPHPAGMPVPPPTTTLHHAPGPHTPHTPYGFPQQAGSYAPTPVPQPPHTPPPAPPQAQPPQRPAPARIDQVRAELDELSDYLRRQDGQQGTGEGGR